MTFHQAKFSVELLCEITSGQVLSPLETLALGKRVSLSTDSRSIEPGQWFVPLSGGNFDGHRYIAQVYAQGATGVFVALSQWDANQAAWQALPNIIGVEDPLKAYMALASWHRHNSNPNLKVVALTGSSGKTTTKDMMFAAFSGLKKTQKTQKNFNNEIGVSQTLLAIEPHTEIAVVEMGMRGLNQIDILSQCAQPNIAYINNVGPAHIEHLGSLDNVAIAKLEIIEGLSEQTGILITNGDDPMLTHWTPRLWTKAESGAEPDGPWRTFSLSQASQIQSTPAGGVSFIYQGKLVILPVPGLHNVQNALGVLEVGLALKLPLDGLISGLASFHSEGGRWNQQWIAGQQNLLVINDAYNANPDSCRASLQTFFETVYPSAAKRILVLGGMKELGNFSDHYHQALGDWLLKLQVTAVNPLNAIITVGEEAALIHSHFTTQASTTCPAFHLENSEALLSLIEQHPQMLPVENAVYFLKGSRSYQLERLITQFQTVPIG